MINMFCVAYRFTGTDTIGIVGKCQCYAIYSCSCQASAVFPGEGISLAIIIAQGIADLVIGDALTSVCSQLVAPVGITIAVSIGAFRICGSNVFSG